LLVHSGEGYLGYVSADDVHRVDAVAFARYPTESSVRMVENHTLDSGLVIPAGSQLKRLPSKGESITVALPTGETAEIAREKCEDANSSAAAIERAIVAAKQLLGTPYHWGGKTSEGIDCSGLVQVAFATTGVHLPRDSNQQFLLGQLTGTRWHRAGLRRGDTLYFLGSYGRIRHTALYLGDDRFLHAQTPVVTIGSFNPDHDEYDPRRAANFAFGKRLWQ
ncbi:MAG: C40 family peptidase, partial [Planctomycetales bacterium]|nr:C40 family peptidase [Planctomycetales bacterium]